MNKTLKTYAVSSLITFLTAFGLVIVSHIDTLTLTTIKNGALAGLLGMALRAGVKALIEYLLSVKTVLAQVPQSTVTSSFDLEK
jgi:hypothetical protein